MRSGRPDRLFGTLRFRLTFWNTVGMLLVGAATLIGLRQGLLYTLSRELSRLTAEDAAEVALIVERYWPDRQAVSDQLQRKAQGHADRDWFGQVLGSDGKVLAESPQAPQLEWPAKDDEQPLDLKGFRVLQRQLVRAGLPPLTVRNGSSLRFISEDVETLTRILILAGVAILLVALPVGYWLAGRATRPIQTIIDTTERLRPHALTERLPIRGTDDELDQLSATINGFLDRLADHLARQRDFVANSAHELRSPLTALRTSIEVALSRERSPVEYQELLADLAEETTGLSALVNQLLLLAEGDADRLRPGTAAVPLHELTERAVDMFQGVAEQRGVALALKRAEQVSVRGDAAHFRQIIHNLVDNAVKFTPSGGFVDVEVGTASDERALLRVRDTGIGIAADDLPQVFDRFFRADRARLREGEVRGNGLGLSICRSIVNVYDGEINVESISGRGATVTVYLPRS